MIEFKRNIQTVLPYDRAHYIDYLADEFDGASLSFQLNIDKIGVAKAVESFEPFFKRTISKLDTGLPWVINHDDFDMQWLPLGEYNMPILRAFFKQNNHSRKWIGAIVLMKDDLFKLAKDLLVYPYGPYKGKSHYRNLDISHSELQFIIKITGHFDVNLLSTNKTLLREIADEFFSGNFEIKQYRGTSLW